MEPKSQKKSEKAKEPTSKADHPMRAIKLEKITLNIGCGGDQGKIEKAKMLLEMIAAGKKPIITVSKRRSTFGVAKGRPVGVKLTLRGEDAKGLLKSALAAVDMRLKSTQFDESGNFSFGVKEYIEMPGFKYRHDIGMFGFDVDVKLYRAGFRVARRKIQKEKVAKDHLIKPQDSMDWVVKNFGAQIV
jgi:large subunit ribosomal protein L5